MWRFAAAALHPCHAEASANLTFLLRSAQRAARLVFAAPAADHVHELFQTSTAEFVALFPLLHSPRTASPLLHVELLCARLWSSGAERSHARHPDVPHEAGAAVRGRRGEPQQRGALAARGLARAEGGPLLRLWLQFRVRAGLMHLLARGLALGKVQLREVRCRCDAERERVPDVEEPAAADPHAVRHAERGDGQHGHAAPGQVAEHPGALRSTALRCCAAAD